MDRKLWPTEKLKSLVERLLKDGCSILLVGAASDRKRTAAVYRPFEKDESVHAISGELGLAECAAAISMCSLFVGPDSGLTHLAAACETPTVAVFGPSDPGKWGYSEFPHAVVHAGLPCSPCFIFGYSKPCSSFQCIEGVEVERVLEACRTALPRKSS